MNDEHKDQNAKPPMTPQERKFILREMSQLTTALDQNEARLADLVRIIGVTESSKIISRIVNDMEEHRKDCSTLCHQVCLVEMAGLATVCAMQRANLAVASRWLGEEPVE